MTAKSMMFMGTGSDVGKSLVVAGLCRMLHNRGFAVAPFKPQNMSNNAAVTADGGEIGRAQALQARACKIAPTTAMNPVLLKPEHETGAQVVVRGQRVASMSAREYFRRRIEYLPEAVRAFHELSDAYDFVLVEGAGSASEVNLRHSDIANFGFAQVLQLPVTLIGDIHRGGVIASIVGTFEVAQPEDAALLKACLINKFHGDPSLFDEGRAFIETRTKQPCFGPLPFYADAKLLPPEDALALDDAELVKRDGLKIVVPRLPRISNFDDLDPLRQETNVSVEIVQPGNPLPRDADLILLPGSKSTIADFEALKAQGWDIDILAHARAGGAVLGLCGGYQMLGKKIHDPEGVEGAPRSIDGLGLLDIETTMANQKQLREEEAVHLATKASMRGYHMHMGETVGADRERPFSQIADETDGAVSRSGKIMGTYLHGLFASDQFRRAFLQDLGAMAGTDLEYEARIDQILDGFADHIERHIDGDHLISLFATPQEINF